MGGVYTLPATADGTEVGLCLIGLKALRRRFITVVQGKSITVNSNTTATDISEKLPC